MISMGVGAPYFHGNSPRTGVLSPIKRYQKINGGNRRYSIPHPPPGSQKNLRVFGPARTPQTGRKAKQRPAGTSGTMGPLELEHQ